MANGFTESETPFFADFTSKDFFLLKNLEWLSFTKYHMKFDFFPVAEGLLIQIIIQRRIQNRVKHLKWSVLWK